MMKANRGPMAGKNMPRGKVNMKNPNKSVKRLLGYIFKNYKIHCFVVLACILISSIASVIGTMFLKNLIDDYILPFINQKE